MTSAARRTRRAAAAALLAAAAWACPSTAQPPGPRARLPERPHVLLVLIDDLRQLRHSPAQPPARLPHLDRLAASPGAVGFSRAYAPVPVCGASRASLLTELAPTADRFLDFDSRVDADAPGAQTLPGFFAAHGYETRGYGKVFHHRDDHLEDWTAGHFTPNAPATGWRQYAGEAAQALAERPGERGPPVEEGRDAAGRDLPDRLYHDARTVDELLGDLEADARFPERPVLYAVGLVKPHLPFVAPGRCWDLYGEADLDPARPLVPAEGLPGATFHESWELLTYSGVPGPPPYEPGFQRRLLHGYLAAASFADAQLGRILDGLDASGLADRTVVVVASDHGYLLGEQGVWTKHALFEPALHVPLVVRLPAGPGADPPPARVDASLVSLTDLFPTLAGFAGLPVPEGLDGRDLSPWLLEPGPPLLEPVVSRWKGGVSVRTPGARVTTWPDGSGVRFDLENDPLEREPQGLR